MVATTQQPRLVPCSKPAKSPSGQMLMACTAQILGRFQKQCACPASATMKHGSCLTLEQMCCIPGPRYQPCVTAYPLLLGTSSTWQLQVSLGSVDTVICPSLTAHWEQLWCKPYLLYAMHTVFAVLCRAANSGFILGSVSALRSFLLVSC